jgi:D-xylose transport system substrate-binding protein
MKLTAKNILLKSLAYLGVAAILSTSCGKKGPVIGFMLPHMTLQRYIIERDIFTQKVRELGGEVIFMSADNDETKQQEQANELISKGVDILVLDPVNRFRAAEMVRAAHNKGIPVISYDRLVANCDIDAFISFDASAIGNQMTSYILNRKPTGQYIVLGGDKTDINAVLIDEAVTKSLAQPQKDGKISVVYKSFIEKYSAEDAEYEIGKFLDLSQQTPDAIITASNMLASGAIKALKKVGLEGKVLVTGQGAEIFACKDILKGNQLMTIHKPVKKMASLTAEIAMKLAKGEKVKTFFTGQLYNGAVQVPSLLLEVITVDANNLRSVIVADGTVNEEELK